MHQTFEVFVHDTRYAVPTLVFVAASTEGRARARARELLLESQFHTQVDVDRNGVRLFTVARDTAFAAEAAPSRRHHGPPLA